MRAKTPGKVSPAGCSNTASEAYAITSVERSVGMVRTRSAPPTSSTSAAPEAISKSAWRNAAWLEAHAVSNRVAATSGMPSADVT